MPLTMRPTGLASPVDEDRQDFTVYCGKWAMGRIYQERGGPDSMRWFWTLYGVVGKPPNVHTNDHAPTLEEAKAQFESAWKQWLAWAKLEDSPEQEDLVDVFFAPYVRPLGNLVVLFAQAEAEWLQLVINLINCTEKEAGKFVQGEATKVKREILARVNASRIGDGMISRTGCFLEPGAKQKRPSKK